MFFTRPYYLVLCGVVKATEKRRPSNILQPLYRFMRGWTKVDLREREREREREK